jgi:hypothetical protein
MSGLRINHQIDERFYTTRRVYFTAVTGYSPCPGSGRPKAKSDGGTGVFALFPPNVTARLGWSFGPYESSGGLFAVRL